jgi:sulfide:quinone oxidoreductase
MVIGIGHPAATCEGAGFEYLMNVHADLKRRGVRELVDLTWITNEPEFGDFGVDGIEARREGELVRGAGLVRMILDESKIRSIAAAGVTKVEQGRIYYEQVGEYPGTLDYDFAMLLPQFRGIPITYTADGKDISSEINAPSGFMKVDADYTPKSFDEYRAADWPAMYRSPKYDNVYAVGIAFATPHPISKPKKTASGLTVIATAPRTGMASGIMGRAAAENIAEQLDGQQPSHHARMSEMPAACIASMGKSLWSGSAASIIMVPVVRDFETYPEYGRDLNLCTLDVGLNGAWTKRLLHSAFLWKLQAKPGWQLIPE